MTRIPLFGRLPAIHRIKDAEQAPPERPGPLQAYLGHVEDAFGAVEASIEALYHDLFIETCADWVIPYLGDLLGASPLAGDPWTLRADVADTILLRRAKGTLGAIERLAHDLTGWGAHPVELRENLVWAQALDHQRPDRGGQPAYAAPPFHRHTVVRGGFATIRDPATLSVLGTPYDTFARFPDVSVPRPHGTHYNLPNLGIFLWRLATNRIARQDRQAAPSPPIASTGLASPHAAWVVRRFVDPLARPVRLFGRSSYDPDRRPPVLTPLDQQPAPIVRARLTSGAPLGNPAAYVAAVPYDELDPGSIAVGSLPLELHLPDPGAGPGPWTFRGADLCAWEAGLAPPLGEREIAIDPRIGRIAIGAPTQAIAEAIADRLVLSWTYAAVGPVGAHPTTRDPLPETWNGRPVPAPIIVASRPGATSLVDALATLADVSSDPLVIEIADSEIHELDLSAVAGRIVEDGGPNLACGRPLFLRAADGQRPIVRLAQPLRLRPVQVAGADQPAIDAQVANTVVRLDGITIVAGAGLAAGDPLIARAAIHALELRGCTLDPGGHRVLDGTPTGGRAPSRTALRLHQPYGFAAAADELAFRETPSIELRRTIAGPLFVAADGYFLSLASSIVDAGPGAAAGAIAISGTGDPQRSFAARALVDGVTIFGRTRVQQISGRGGIFTGRLSVDDDQTGCLEWSWFSGDGDRLPQHAGCVQAPEARVVFASEWFGHEAYGQLDLATDRRVLECGPDDDQMGAFGFLLEAHKWKNLNVRLRELVPVGVRPLLIPAS
ncbi:MAG: hypothetical protein ACTHU0_11220 [Kofleriaceae bacterium]